MRLRTYNDAEVFLEHTRLQLEWKEAANSLILGICGQLVRHPQSYAVTPCLKTVEDETGLVLAAVMTPPHKLVVYGHQGDLDGAAGLVVEDLVSDGRPVPGVLGPSAVAWGFAERWTEATGQGYGLVRQQTVHQLREVKSPIPEQGRLKVASPKDVGLVARWSYAFKTELFGRADQDQTCLETQRRTTAGDIYLWEDPGPVSMAMATRPTRSGISVSLAYTPPDLRGRGFATACVGELSRLLLRSGRSYCALFVDRKNAPAKRVYHKVGYEPISEYDEYVFWRQPDSPL